MKDALKASGIILVIMLLVWWWAWHDMTIWKECRQTNSVLYCVNLLGK